MSDRPQLAIIAGPNGAGKSTVAPNVLAEALRDCEFVNADTIALGLSAFDPDRVAIQAGRIMIQRLKQLASERARFAFETTLATRSFAPWIAELAQGGYRVDLCYVWVRSSELAVERVAQRVRLGGHAVPEETIRRRYIRSLQNLVQLYLPLASEWSILDNSSDEGPLLIANGGMNRSQTIVDEIAWEQIQKWCVVMPTPNNGTLLQRTLIHGRSNAPPSAPSRPPFGGIGCWVKRLSSPTATALSTSPATRFPFPSPSRERQRLGLASRLRPCSDRGRSYQPARRPHVADAADRRRPADTRLSLQSSDLQRHVARDARGALPARGDGDRSLATL